jgi:hypothetical protein
MMRIARVRLTTQRLMDFDFLGVTGVVFSRACT